MEIQAEKNDRALILSIKGKMDTNSSPEFEKQLSEWIAGGEKIFLLELSGLDYISSAGLRSILSTAKKLKGMEGKLLLASLQGVVREVFDMSGFSSIIPIYESTESALSEV
ncbi:MAG: STAS domain-containing protein [Pseudomonadota bacterium]